MFPDDAPVWKTAPSVANLLLKGQDQQKQLELQAKSQQKQQRENSENRLRLVQIIEWFLGHFTQDFANELVTVLEMGAKIFLREAPQGPPSTTELLELFRAEIEAKKKSLPIINRLKASV